MYEEDLQELGRKRARRDELRQKLADSCNNRKAAKERIRAAYLTTFITRLNDEIFQLEKNLGVDPEEVGASE